MYKKLLIICITILSLKVSSQTYTFRSGLKEMCGNPGDVFSCSFSFTNTASSPISIFINRYQKTLPSYWYSCYCYNVCNSPLRDTLTLHIPAFSTDVVYVQFKTDSVNSGSSISDFTINQVGFASVLDSVQLSASTACNLTSGISNQELSSDEIKLFPVPANENISVLAKHIEFKEIRIYNIVGCLKEIIKTNDDELINIELRNYESGLYMIECFSTNRKYILKFVKQ